MSGEFGFVTPLLVNTGVGLSTAAVLAGRSVGVRPPGPPAPPAPPGQATWPGGPFPGGPSPGGPFPGPGTTERRS